MLSTTGGTSDARFIKDICPVIEFGSVGKTMHQINENILIKDLLSLQKIYENLYFNMKNFVNSQFNKKLFFNVSP